MTKTLVDMAVAIERVIERDEAIERAIEKEIFDEDHHYDWQCQSCGAYISSSETHCPCRYDIDLDTDETYEYSMETALDEHDWRYGHEPAS